MTSVGIEHDTHRKSEQARVEALWLPSVKAHARRQAEERRAAWIEYRRHMRNLHWRLGDEHDAELQKLENGHHEEARP